MQKFKNQVLRFGFIGILNTLIDFLVFNLLIFLTGTQGGIFLVIINLVSVSIAILNSFILNSIWVFRKERIQIEKIYRFLFIAILGMIINNLVILTGLKLFSRTPLPVTSLINVLKILGVILSGTFNYLFYKYWVFKVSETLAKPNKNWVPGLVSIILPAYNEEERLPVRLQNLAMALPDLFPVEIIVVNDGSKDQTQTKVQAIANNFKHIHCLNLAKNRGKGAAVRAGMLTASGEFLIFTDADDTYTLDHIIMIANQLRSGADIVIGIRKGEQGQRLVGESLLRQWMGKIFNLIIQALLLPGLKDTQCGLKGFHRHAADQIFPRQRLNRFAFDVELLALARVLGLNITQIPVYATVSHDSRVNPLSSPLMMGIEVLKLKYQLFVNSYKLPGIPTPAHEFIIGFSFLMAAVAIRLPWLWEIPRFIDELKEVNLAYLIYLGKAKPLHNMAKDIGAMHNYILAGIFQVFGPNIYWPRLYVMITGSLTVVLVYILGKKLYNKTTGLLAAGLLLTNGLHILTTHMAWANCTTPFFFTLALIATVLTEKKRSGKWLIISSLLWAATLQTHASVIVYVSIMAIYLYRPRFRKQTGIGLKWFGFAAITFIAGYSNMLYFNLLSKGGSIRWLGKKTYALENKPGLFSYVINLHNMFIELMRTVSATYSDHRYIWSYLSHPLFVLAILILVYGSYQAIKSQKTLPVWILIGSFMIIPWVNSNYWFFLYTRYIMPVVICALLLISYGLVRLSEEISQLSFYRGIYPKLATLCLILFISGQLIPYWQYCNQMSETNYSNRMTLQVYFTINKILRQNHESIVLLDNYLSIENDPLPFLFTLGKRNFFKLPESNQKDAKILLKNWNETLEKFPNKKLIAIIDGETYSSLQDFVQQTNQIDYLTCKVIKPRSPKIGLREVYIVELIPLNLKPLKDL